jgi:hypothetical protein
MFTPKENWYMHLFLADSTHITGSKYLQRNT